MKFPHFVALSAVIAIIFLTGGCMESPIKEPTVSVGNITLSDVSLQTMTVNTTVVLNNPNPIGAKLNKLAFDVYYLDDTPIFLGHGEKSDIEVKDNGNTTVTIPVVVGNVPAIHAMGSLLRKGSITLRVNGSAFIDVKVTSFEKRFEQNRVFELADFTGLLPVTTIPGTSINITDKLRNLGGYLNSV
jgi:LEA14-like dessication related protein